MNTDPQTLAKAIWEAAYDDLRGDRRAVRNCVRALVDEQERVVDAAADIVLHRAIGHVWSNGWLPYDVVRVVRQERDGFADALIVDAIAADSLRYSPATVHKRWQEQLGQIDAVAWWELNSPHLSQWAQRHILSRDEALTVVVSLLVVLMTLPKLPRILPLPGTATISAAGGRAGVDQKVLARVRGLLAKAESTQFPEEAEALSAKAQELMNRHAFERAALDADAHVPQAATSRRMWLDTPYVGAKAQLVNVVGAANRCRGVVYEKIGFIALLGDDMDVEITELLATSLLLQATKAMVHAGSTATRDDESRSRTYRQSFLLAYAGRIGERLYTVTEVAEADERLLPVLVSREQAVDELFEKMFPSTVAKSYTVRSAAGWGAGRAAADLADLGVNRIPIDQSS